MATKTNPRVLYISIPRGWYIDLGSGKEEKNVFSSMMEKNKIQTMEKINGFFFSVQLFQSPDRIVGNSVANVFCDGGLGHICWQSIIVKFCKCFAFPYISHTLNLYEKWMSKTRFVFSFSFSIFSSYFSFCSTLQSWSYSVSSCSAYVSRMGLW